MATPNSFPLRWQSPEQRARVAKEAASRGMSVNAYILSVVDPAAEGRARLLLDTARATYAWAAAGPEFADLDEQLAAGPHSTSAELGFDPAARAAREVM